jgi:hypothetical protein
VSQGPGWWVASDGKWYAPELHPDAAPEEAADTVAVAGPERRRRTSPTRRVLVAVIALLLVVGVVVAILASTKTTDTADTTRQGPPTSVSPRSVAVAVSLSRGDVPRTWTSNGEAGLCIAGKGAGVPGTPYCGNAPFPGTSQLDETLARCVGVPVSQLSMLTGTDELGEPFTYTSSTFTAPSTSAPDTVTSDNAPEAVSFFTLEPSVSHQTSDLAAFAKPSFIPCMEAWAKTIPAMTLVQGIASAAGIRMTVSAPVGHRIRVRSAPGVHVVAFEETEVLRTSTVRVTTQAEGVIMGAGRVEVVLNLSGTASDPFPPALAQMLITREEQRVARAAAR